MNRIVVPPFGSGYVIPLDGRPEMREFDAAPFSAHFSATAFRLARPVSKSLPIMRSMSQKMPMTLERKGLNHDDMFSSPHARSPLDYRYLRSRVCPRST